MLIDFLRMSIALEVPRVTESTMALVVADRDRWAYATDQADRLRASAYELTKTSEEDRTADWLTQYEHLCAEGERTEQQANATALGLISAHGDDMLYGGPQCQRVFAAAVRTLAHLALLPGGVHFAGLHWCRGHNGIPIVEGELCILDMVRGREGT